MRLLRQHSDKLHCHLPDTPTLPRWEVLRYTCSECGRQFDSDRRTGKCDAFPPHLRECRRASLGRIRNSSATTSSNDAAMAVGTADDAMTAVSDGAVEDGATSKNVVVGGEARTKRRKLLATQESRLPVPTQESRLPVATQESRLPVARRKSQSSDGQCKVCALSSSVTEVVRLVRQAKFEVKAAVAAVDAALKSVKVKEKEIEDLADDPQLSDEEVKCSCWLWCAMGRGGSGRGERRGWTVTKQLVGGTWQQLVQDAVLSAMPFQ